MTDRFIDELEAREITKLSRTTRYRMSKTGEFPQKYQISKGRSAYLESDIQKWIDKRTKPQI